MFDQSPPAHRYGIRAFDTSPYYDNSEIVLGTALKALEHEFPRDTYRLLTKVGRYGPSPGSDPSATDFDYSPATIRRSVRRSLQRLHTHYLDVVYLHDIEFVAPCVAPRAEGNHLTALGAEAAAYGLPPPERDFFPNGEREQGTGSIGTFPTTGDDDSDERILEAVSELRALQAEGLIRQVGICGPSILLTPLTHHPYQQTNELRSTPTDPPPHRAPSVKPHRPSPGRSPNLCAPNAPKRHSAPLRTSPPHARTGIARPSRFSSRHGSAPAPTNRPTRVAPGARSAACGRARGRVRSWVRVHVRV